jgi:VCBS repeat-containing protein
MVDGGSGNDLLFGGAGNDTLVGGAGNDYLFAGKGNDFASYSMVENLGPGPEFKDVGTYDVYDGGYGFDTLQLTLTHGESRLDSVQRDIADYRAFLADHANPGSDCGPTFHFGSFDLDARGFEALAIQLVNSAPTANDDAGAIDEDTSLVVPAAGVLANDTDPDHLDQLTVVPSKTVSELGAAVVVNLDGSYTYDSNGQFEYLAAGECVTDSFSYTIVDLAGATDTATVTVTVTGENDAPVAQAIAQDANEDMGNPVALKADFNDVDTHDKHTFSIDTSGTMGHVTNSNDGTFSYDPNGQFEYLAAGKSATDTFSYTVTDNHGASSTRTAVVTIHGKNDAATITGDRSGEVVEAGGVANGTHGISFASGDFNVSDVDTGEAVFQTPSSLAGTYGDFTFDAATGAWTYTLDNGAANVQALNDGALVHDVAFAVSSLDGTDARTISIAVHGANDAPMITSNGGGELANVLVAENTTAVTTVIAADVDNGHKLTFSKFGGADEAMFSIDDKTGVLTFNDAPDFENPTDDGMNNTYNVIVQVSDEHGATDLQSIAVTVTGNNPPVAAADSVITNVSPGDALFIPEWALLANDSDPDGNPIAVTNVGGASAGDSLNWPSTTRPGFVEFNDQTEDVPSSFTYAATDGLAASAPAIVNVTQDMDGVLNGTPGNNILVGAPNESTHFVGNSGNDIMFGGNFADMMNGNNGNDTLVGGGGDDTLTGGDGNDIFDYNALSDRGDVIYGFQSGSDQLDLRDLLDTFAGYNGSNAFTGYLQFIDGPGPGTNTLVQVDSDGGGDSFQTLATLDGVAASSIDNSDFIL